MYHSKIENLYMKINKNFLFHKKIIILIITIISVGLVGCGYTRDEKERMEEYKKQAEQNAIAYIEEKYNFTPSIESLECDFIDPSPIPDFTPSPSGDVYVDANDGSRSFKIYITGTKPCSSGKDDYQADAIKRDIEAFYDNIIKIDKKSISVGYGRYNTFDNKISEYYDQTNLPEIIKKYNFKIIVEYIDKTFDELDDIWTDPSVKEPVELLEDMDIMLVSYRDEQAYEFAGGYNYYISHDPGLFFKDNDYIMCINELAKILDHEIEHTKYPVKQIDDILYFVTDGYRLIVEQVEEDIVFPFQYKSLIYKYEKTYNTHSITSNAKSVLVFMPYDKIRHSKFKQNGFGIQYTENNEIKYEEPGCGLFGPYMYTIIYPRQKKNIYISLFNESNRFDFIQYPPLLCSKYTNSTEISAGDTPEILEACPTDTGL